MEHILISHSSQLIKRWEQPFPDLISLASISSLDDLDPSRQRIIWLDLGGVRAEQKAPIVQQTVGFGWPVIILTYTPSDEEAFEVISSGAYGYSHAMAAPDQLREIGTVVESGSLWVGAGLMQRMLSLSKESGVVSNRPAELFNLLTPREQMVAEQVALGASNRQISEKLDIAERTVKAHLSTIFGKLQVRDRVQLALTMNNIPV